MLSACLADCPVAVSLFLNSPNDHIACVAGQLTLAIENEDDKLLSSMCAFIFALCLVHGNDESGVGVKITKVS